MADLTSLPLATFAEALGGAGLFILGMKTMSEGLQHLAGNRFRTLLERAARNRYIAAFFGTCLASLLQSGSSASILVIGFVNAGLVSLYQALAILLGTGVGATVAVQFIAFQVSDIALIAIFLGILLKFFFKRRYLVNSGELLLGAGLLFLGLRLMESGFAPIGRLAIVKSINEYVFAWRISAVLFGALITFLVQSASAATGIVIALAGSGMVSFADAIGMTIGSNLGVAMITAFAAVSGTLTARRVAAINLAINFSSVLLVLILLPFFIKAVFLCSPGGMGLPPGILKLSEIIPERSNLPRLIANAHTLFSILSMLFFLPFIGFITRSADVFRSWSGAKGDISPHPRFLDTRVINTPTIAMLQARNEISRMADIACSMYGDAMQLLYRFDAKSVRLINEKEGALDSLQKHISDFLVMLSRRHLDSENSTRITSMLHIVNELEHLGDINMTVIELLQRKKYDKVHFSIQAMSDLKKLAAVVAEITAILRSVPDFSSEELVNSVAFYKVVLEMQQEMLASHVTRMKSGHCSVDAGLLYNDIIATFVKIADISCLIVRTGRESE